jgi:hypothetical protein
VTANAGRTRLALAAVGRRKCEPFLLALVQIFFALPRDCIFFALDQLYQSDDFVVHEAMKPTSANRSMLAKAVSSFLLIEHVTQIIRVKSRFAT